MIDHHLGRYDWTKIQIMNLIQTTQQINQIGLFGLQGQSHEI